MPPRLPRAVSQKWYAGGSVPGVPKVTVRRLPRDPVPHNSERVTAKWVPVGMLPGFCRAIRGSQRIAVSGPSQSRLRSSSQVEPFARRYATLGVIPEGPVIP